MGCCNSTEKSTEIDSEVYEAYELEEKKFGLTQNTGLIHAFSFIRDG